MAARLRAIFKAAGIPLAVDSPTNQQFVVLKRNQYTALSEKIKFEVWEPSEKDEIVCRFVTSWATTEADIQGLEQALSEL
jgi:threonine aldolase